MECLEHLLKVLKMKLDVEAIYKDIIKVNHHKVAHELSKHLSHQSHESARGIRCAKWHHHPLIEAIFCFESGLPFISGSNAFLVVFTL